MNSVGTKSDKIRNIGLFVVVTVAVALLLIVRFGQLSITKMTNNVDLVEYGQSNEQRSSITEARRGTIFDRNGQPIAMDTTSYSMYAVLNSTWSDDIVGDRDHTAKVLAQYIDLPHDEILAMLFNDEASQIEFGDAGRQLSPETKNLIEAEQLPGIVLVSNTSRRYLNDYFASHLIGYAVTEETENEVIEADILAGQIGIEKSMNSVLSGQTAYEANLAYNLPIDVMSGDDLYLTLDARLQNYLEDIMTAVFQRYQPKELGAYLIEVETGQLIAASQRPSFNLNTREGIDLQWQNMMVEEAFEPGSTIKILTMAIAYDLQLYQPSETFTSGSIEVYDQTVSDYNLVGWGDITFEEGLARSSNVGFVNLVERMGDEKWIEQLRTFGFGVSTQSGLPNETNGSLEFDNPVSRIMSGFGQGFSASPIQLLQAYTSIGNDGKMMKIQYIKEAVNNHQFQEIEIGTPITADAANRVLEIMVDTVEEPYGTAKMFKKDNVKIAAKTGTAQIANPNGLGYLTGPNDYYFSVVSFFPAENPKYMLYLSMKQPSVTHGMMGTNILAELFHPFVDYIMINE